LADRLCIVDQGKIVAEGTPAELKAQVGADKIRLWFKAEDTEACEKAAKELSNLPNVEEVGKCIAGITTEEGLEITAKNGSAVVTQVVRALDKAEVPIEQLRLTAPTLDEVFLKLTGKTLNVVERKEAVRPGRRRH